MHRQWQYQIKTEPIHVPDIQWWMQASEPIYRKVWGPIGDAVYPIEWLFWGWLQQVCEPVRELRILEGDVTWPIEWLYWGWYEQHPEPLAEIRVIEDQYVYPVEWLFWGWLEQDSEPQREIIYDYLAQAMAEAPFRMLFMQPRDYLGF